jgi:hypothetical protein
MSISLTRTISSLSIVNIALFKTSKKNMSDRKSIPNDGNSERESNLEGSVRNHL